jgi:hypothetical protein
MRAVLPARSKTVLQVNDTADEIVTVAAKIGIHGSFQAANLERVKGWKMQAHQRSV